MLLAVTVETSVDMTLPLWGIAGTMAVCIIFVVNLYIKILLMEKDMKLQNKELIEIKNLLFEFIKPEKRNGKSN